MWTTIDNTSEKRRNPKTKKQRRRGAPETGAGTMITNLGLQVWYNTNSLRAKIELLPFERNPAPPNQPALNPFLSTEFFVPTVACGKIVCYSKKVFTIFLFLSWPWYSTNVGYLVFHQAAVRTHFLHLAIVTLLSMFYQQSASVCSVCCLYLVPVRPKLYSRAHSSLSISQMSQIIVSNGQMSTISALTLS